MDLKTKTIVLLVVCFSLRSHDCSAAPKLRRNHVKAVQTDEGNIVDCVDIYNQPSLSHPLLKNHKIQLKSSANFPHNSDRAKSILGSNMPSSEAGFSRNGICPEGTVPIYRTTKEERITARNITRQFFGKTGQNPNTVGPRDHEVMIKMKKDVKFKYFGALGSTSIYNLSLTPNHISTSNIWVEAGPVDRVNSLIAGTIVSPTLNGDSRPRLFVYWTADNNKRTGCFNFVCKGFIQVSQEIAPKIAVEPVSTIGGETFEIKYNIYQDPITGNWWFVALEQNVVIGYWSKEIVPELAHGADEVSWGAISSGNDGFSPPMGSGRFPDGFYDTAAYFRNLHFALDGLKQFAPRNDDPNLEELIMGTSKCFKMKNDRLTSSDYWGYRFLYGGPGGSNCSH